MIIKYYTHILLYNLLFESLKCETKNYSNVVPVNTISGPINGLKQTFNGIELDVFLSIPYAEPPINNLRFKKPIPVKQWTQPLAANRWPDNCYQIIFTFELKNLNYSEDCLYLNIWTPNRVGVDIQLKAVIIFIYGGALYYGSSTQDIFDAKVLATKGDVVVVTFNYRLDAFGFLYTDSYEAPGNMGLWDQLMAIQWVNDNIEYFGGDPKRITLMGQSAGAWSVSLHLLANQSQQLFQNAILMSGAVYNHLTNRGAEQMKDHWLRAAISIGCGEDYSYVDFTPQIMECLRKASPRKILQLATETELSVPKLGWFRLVVIDGDFLADKPINLLKTIRFNNSKNVMIGTVEDEGILFLYLFYDPIKYDLISPKNFTISEAIKELELLSNHFETNLQIIGEEVSELYFHGLTDDTDSDEIRSRISTALGDFHITCPTIKFAELLYHSNPENLNVYQYYYTNRLGDTSCSKRMKACHGSDLYSVFGIPIQRSKFSSKREEQISQQMIDLFSHFAKFGYPENQNGFEFTPYYMISNKVMKPYYEISETPKPITNFGIGLKTIECEYLWNEFLDN